MLVSLSYFDASEAERAKLRAIKPNTNVVVEGKHKSFVGERVELTDARLVRIEK